MTLKQYATLVKQLRDGQKANGTGYKTPAGSTLMTRLEREVDAATTKALEGWPRNLLESIDS